MNKIKILVADDHNIVRESLIAFLKQRKNFQIIGEASNGIEAVKKTKELNPDIVLMDIGMPGMDGLEATKLIVKNNPAIKIIALTVHDEEGYVLEVIHSGAKGYLLKNTTSDELINAVEMVFNGELYYSREVSQVVVQQYYKTLEKHEELNSLNLTAREKEVLKLIANGLQNKEIAEKLFLSIRTVEAHRDSIKKKLKINSTAGLIKYAIKIGLIEVK